MARHTHRFYRSLLGLAAGGLLLCSGCAVGLPHAGPAPARTPAVEGITPFPAGPTAALPARAGLAPEQVAVAFYTWYISALEASFEGGPSPYDVSALSQGGYLSPALVASVLAQREALSGAPGGADPILCAQDVPTRVQAAATSQAAGDSARVPLTSDLIGHAWALDMERVDGLWRIAGIDCLAEARAGGDAPLPLDTRDPGYTPAPTGPENAPVGGRGNVPPADLGLVPAREGWVLYHNETYGFHLSYPADWTHQEHVSAPGQPPLGPEALEALVLIMPQAWAEAMAARGAAPSADAPAIAPYTLEIVRGDAEALRALYPPPAIAEPCALGGWAAERWVDAITEDLSQTRIVVLHPEDPTLWLVLTDSISGFPDRLSGNEAIAATWAEILDTVRLY